ncbi:MAG: Na+/H+ antiporter subunit E [Candidatus Omnitrophica bacterium]|nr:Na+/H+ antiporter subunit E [Candidatus Omnitrophota bacterium]MBU1932512.1 Na+/H+ antiporter subunit E [Candidatus Omnitrophota bacterium]
MASRIILFILGFIAWALLNWVPDWQHMVIGIFVSAFVAYMTGDFFVKRTHLLTHPRRYLWFLYYVPVFIWECLKANIDVAYRVIHPDLPIHPGIVKVKTSLRSDVALTFLSNSITLTPGTLTVDVDKEKGFLYVHWIEVRHKDVEKATKIVVERFENILKRIFEE